jgi:hypothetical protein
MFNSEKRLSDTPFVEQVWRMQTEHAGTFISAASAYGEFVVTKYQGQSFVTMRGPETQASFPDMDVDLTWAEFFGGRSGHPDLRQRRSRQSADGAQPAG